eukprot:5145498-Prymnesium_polylepis.1
MTRLGAITTTARGAIGHAVADKRVYSPRDAPPQGQAADRRLQADDREVGHRLRLGQLGRRGFEDVRRSGNGWGARCVVRAPWRRARPRKRVRTGAARDAPHGVKHYMLYTRRRTFRTCSV